MAQPGFKLSLKGRALRLLSQREHSRAELVRKLSPHEEVPGELAQALDDLQAKGFIDETRVLESVLNHRTAKLGNGRIKQELQAKGLAPAAVAQAMLDLKDSELERAKGVWQKKFGAPAADANERAKHYRFLLTRGFSSEVVRKVVKQSGAPDEDFER
ncbi:MAG: recombination regulator RecX [Burkholderiales bacterium]|nr:recombination regulator RecX [Burkholderiales bacterium]